jgi:chemotaxis protein CheD
MSTMPGFEITPVVHLHPGQIYIAAEPATVMTILGSCVAVCLWDPHARIAGINHFLLPSIPIAPAVDARYGNTAMQRLIDDIVARGASKSRLTAKVFGGANVILAFVPKKPIGTQNVEVAREVLGRNGIEIVAEQTGGRRGRKLHFDTATGAVRIKEL